MNNELSIIKNYAQESIQYGTKSGNRKALQRGNDIMFAVDKIESFYKSVTDILNQTKVQSKALDIIEDEMVTKYADLLDPQKFKTSLDWRKAIDQFIN